jgi:hypothetical protein
MFNWLFFVIDYRSLNTNNSFYWLNYFLVTYMFFNWLFCGNNYKLKLKFFFFFPIITNLNSFYELFIRYSNFETMLNDSRNNSYVFYTYCNKNSDVSPLPTMLAFDLRYISISSLNALVPLYKEFWTTETYTMAT